MFTKRLRLLFNVHVTLSLAGMVSLCGSGCQSGPPGHASVESAPLSMPLPPPAKKLPWYIDADLLAEVTKGEQQDPDEPQTAEKKLGLPNRDRSDDQDQSPDAVSQSKPESAVDEPTTPVIEQTAYREEVPVKSNPSSEAGSHLPKQKSRPFPFRNKANRDAGTQASQYLKLRPSSPDLYLDPPPQRPLTLPDGRDGFQGFAHQPEIYPPLLAADADGQQSSFDSPTQADQLTDSTKIANALPSADGTLSLRNDLQHLWPALHDDVLSIVTWKNAVILGAGVGGAIAIRQDTDRQVREDTAAHPDRWGAATPTLGYLGEYYVQIPVLAAFYGYTLWDQNVPLHDFSCALNSSFGIAAVSTLAIKGIANTNRPSTDVSGGHYGFPSYHTSTGFAMAATVEEYCGWQWGLPAYALAGMVGWSRIDGREHDLSDVVFGAVLGYVIGKSVAAAHLTSDSKFQINPYYDPQQQAAGVVLEAPF